jgi:hypothetical protein
MLSILIEGELFNIVIQAEVILAVNDIPTQDITTLRLALVAGEHLALNLFQLLRLS